MSPAACRTASSELSERLLGVTVPNGGLALMLVELYCDESIADPKTSILCVAGYLFEKGEAIKFERESQDLLAKYGLPYFRMSACANGTKPFKELSMNERIDVETTFIELINKRMAQGFAVTVDPAMYVRVMPIDPNLGASPYSFCARSILTGARR
jgi:hypothetical protein